MPSIPSRIETTLYKGFREKKGFGVRSQRFDASPVPGQDLDIPGPGSYAQQKPFYEEVLERSGWGKRGTGGFASRSRRFGARSMPQMPVLGRGVPGPGAYEPLPTLEKLKRPTDFNQASETAVFARPSDNPICARQRSLSAPQPGPGQYNSHNSKHDVVHRAAAIAAFRSASQRGLKLAPDGHLLPGPGEYISPDGPRNRPSTPGNEPCNAVFHEPSKRRFTRVHPDLPAADEKARKVLGKLASEVAHECIGTQGEKSLAALPGPGNYEIDRDELWSIHQAGHLDPTSSSSFQLGSKRHDWVSKDMREDRKSVV